MAGVVVSLLLLGCGTDDATTSQPAGQSPDAATDEATISSTDDLTGTIWDLVSFDVDGEQQPAAAESFATFAEGGVFGGSTGCNRFRGSWEQDGATLALDAGATTLVACADPAVNDQEQALLALFPQVAVVERADDALTLVDADGSALLTYAAGLTDLAGTEWTATGVNNAMGGLVSSEETSTVTAEFAEDGTVSGFTGCRDYSGTWQAGDEPGGISVTDVTTEGEDCTGEPATLETQYLRALEITGIFQVEGATLYLREGPTIDTPAQATFTRATS